ncbi:hypothetical protein V1520DRAFT_368194 [Lipomyces starkeyi]|uniref:Uncharacterized protein n=1 Tax=Lipomyces starkeyi NRRL Y-11557 TaxID=675824 RepID=A0A1E3Q501_LIPST|nr:hypothetical protein LIPSTDRAFT_105313 [Lipomyces starkeyi NRRL Y-11557]
MLRPPDSDASVRDRRRSVGKLSTPLLRLDTNVSNTQSQNYTIVNRAKELARNIRDQLTSARNADQKEHEDLERLEDELRQRLKDIEMHVKHLQDMRDQIEEFTRVLDQENERAGSEFAVKLDKIETFRQELGVVDQLEKRLKDSTARVDDYKERLESIRQAIDDEQKRQIDMERRTYTQQNIFWSCVSVGAVVLIVSYVIQVYR